MQERNNSPTNSVFFCIVDGKAMDTGIVDELLENDQEITRQLIEAGVILGFVVVDVVEDWKDIEGNY